MTDPAIEAARRASAPFDAAPEVLLVVEAAAREALKPIRELHRRNVTMSAGQTITGTPMDISDLHRDKVLGVSSITAWCPECGVLWPCVTAKFAYTTEELE